MMVIRSANTNQYKSSCKDTTLTEIMLEFVRSSIFSFPAKIDSANVIDWDKLFDISVSHELIAFVWDGVCLSHLENQLSRQQRISWGLSAQEIYDQYYKCEKSLKLILDICNKNNIRLLLLKGIGLSKLYPQNCYRCCKDIDIYLFEDYAMGNKLLANDDYKWQGKHSIFQFEGVTIENHLFFFQLDTKRKRLFNKYIESSLKDVTLTDDGYYVLSPISNLVFLALHALKHCSKDHLIPYKGIFDFGLYLYRYYNELDPRSCNKVLSELKIVKSFVVLVCLSEVFLGIEFKDYHFKKVSDIDIRQIVGLFIRDRSSQQSRLVDRINHHLAYQKLMKYIPRNSKYRTILHRRLIEMIKHN